MKQYFKLLMALLLCTLGQTKVFSQAGVLDPADPIVAYSSANPPAVPNWNTMVKWVRTKRLSWNTDSYKAYFFNGLAFRLKFPKSYQHGVSDGKKYPVFIFLHGLGEKGTIYDNEYQLYHGGQLFRDSVDQGKFDGFLLFPQSQYEYMGAPQFDALKDIVEKYLAVQVKADLNRVFVNGLSAGGVGTWEFTLRHPQLFAASLPMSAANYTFQSATNVNKLKYNNIWHFQGGLDRNPSPETSKQLGGILLAAGTNYKYTEFPNRGHDCWYQTWQLPGFFNVLRNYNKLNPIPLFGKYQFCEGETPNVTLSLSAGFSAYEWRKDGVVIPGATSNTYQVTTFGTYDVRVRRGTEWSEWSPIPAVVKLKDPTIAPPIKTSAGLSNVIPSPSGNSTTLELPEGYTSYTWQKVGSTATVGTSNTLTVTTPGDYIVKVTEEFGCLSPFSAPFNVASSTGPNKPEVPSNLYVTTLSMNQLRIDWNENPYPENNETGYEIYKSTSAGGPYSLAGTTQANATSFIVNGLSQGVTYYFAIRAINSTAASSLSKEVSGSTNPDSEPPSVPSNLRVTASSGTSNSASLAWNASTDNVGLNTYDIYINGSKSYSTTNTTFTCYNLGWNTTYNITVKARDVSGNISAPSNQVNVYIPPNGLIAKAFTGSWTQLPDFNTLPIQLQRTVTNVSISSVGIPSTQDNFGLLFEGFINITTPGSYTFRLNSDEGSKLWLQEYDANAVPLVNNDGIHLAQNANGTITLAAGLYPISIAYFDRTGTHSLTLSWTTPTNSTFVAVPNSAFVGTTPASTVLNTPSELTASPNSPKRISLTWVDNSANETGFEIWRSTSLTSGYANVATVAANSTSYADSIGLSANTRYYYQIRAINQTGASTFSHINEAKWSFDNNYVDSSGSDRSLTQSGTPTFDAVNKIQGSHALNFNGTTQSLAIGSTNNFLREAYSERTIAFWMRSTNNTGNRVIFDIGGNDDGLCLRLNNNTLLAGIAANNTRVALDPVVYDNSNWNHVVLVYKANTLKLYLNGVLVQSNTSLPFTALTTTTNASSIGINNGTNAFNATTGYGRFVGQIDEFAIYSGGLTDTEVASLMSFQYLAKSATTFSLPAVPVAPSDLVASGTSANSINLAWADNSTNETQYQVFRSNTTNENFVLVATLPANSTAFTDVDLFPNQINYYKVRGVNTGIVSEYSNEDSAITLNNAPVLLTIANQYMRFNTQLNLEVKAVDNDGSPLVMNVSGLPAFATYNQAGNVLTINFNPATSDQGSYTIGVTVTDQQGVQASQNFNLTVNDNYNPSINPVSSLTVNEKQNAQLVINAGDANNDALQWSFVDLPDFVTVTPNGNSVTLNANPGYSHNGTYFIKAKVADANFGFDTTTITLNVINVNPPNSKVYINFTPNSTQFPVGAPWNSTNRLPATNSNFPNLLNETGTNSGIGFIILTPWQNQLNGTNTTGVNTGNNSGIYPDNVMRTAYFTSSPAQEMKFYGLNPDLTYSFTFFGSRGAVSDDRTSVYTINGSSVSLNAANNSTNTVTLFNVTPAADSSVILKLDKGGASAYGYINALVIESVYNDGTIPATPRNVSASISNGKVNLSWVDAAYNEAAYEIYRSTNIAGPFSLINPGANNVDLQAYTDNSISGNVHYFYTIRTVNQYGNSAYSDTVSIITPNTSPVVGIINDIKLKTEETVSINFNLQDDAGDVISLSATGLPAFATITNNGNGTGTIFVNPGSIVGKYNVSLTAKDDKGASVTREFKITVTDKSITSYYVNFNTTIPVTESPWNSFNSLPIAGKVLSNIKNDNDDVTGVSITLVDAWESANDLGATTDNNTGIYPDNVMKTNFYESSSSIKRIRVSGLSVTNKKYNLIFFGSRLGGDNRTTVYSVGGQSVSLNAANNISNTVQINGLSPDASGVIEFTAQKAPGAIFAYINALVIQEFVDDGTPLAPTSLTVVPNSNSSIKLNWNDKSAGEEGFEIHRSDKFNGPFTLVATSGSNATSYIDNNLKPNTVYYYKVRAKVTPLFSNFSNTAGTATHTFSVYMNFNRTNSAILPWNNTNAVPEQDMVYTNMNSEVGKPTGLRMQITKNFNGDNPDGMNTGNNSGIVPDAVLRSSWWVDKGSEAQLKISGLNLNMAYTFRFVASRNGAGDRTTVYTIDGKSVSLNASYNTTQTVQLDHIRPDENGQVVIDISMTEWALFGYLNGMIISGYQIPDTSGVPPSTPSMMVRARNSELAVEPVTNIETSQTDKKVVVEIEKVVSGEVVAYPNPFTDNVTVSANFAKPLNRVTVRVSDISGRLVHQQNFTDIKANHWGQRVNLSNKNLSPGIYLLQLLGPDNKPIATFRLVKTK